MLQRKDKTKLGDREGGSQSRLWDMSIPLKLFRGCRKQQECISFYVFPSSRWSLCCELFCYCTALQQNEQTAREIKQSFRFLQDIDASSFAIRREYIPKVLHGVALVNYNERGTIVQQRIFILQHIFLNLNLHLKSLLLKTISLYFTSPISRDTQSFVDTMIEGS